MAIMENFEINGESYDIVDSEAVHFSSQSLTTAQQTQARNNINASKPIVYSTSETLTGDTWIDGKPIYRRVISFTGSGEEEEHITLAPFSEPWSFVVRFYGGLVNSNDTYYTLPSTSVSSVNGQWYIYIDTISTTPEIHIRCGSSRFIDGPAVLIVEYTKP